MNLNFRPRGSASTILVALLLAHTGLILPTGKALSHEAPCPYCKLGLVQNTETQDNEVVLMYGKKRIEYRCLFCALADLKKYKGDVTINAPTEQKGMPAVLTRTGTEWVVADSLVFVNAFKRHKTCADESRAFTSRAAFDVWASAAKVEGASPLTFPELMAAVQEKSKK